MLKKTVISVIVVFLVIFVLVRVSSTIKEYSDMGSIHEKIVKVVDRLNAHIEQMDPTTKNERAKSFERLAKNLQPFIMPFFESGMGKNQEDPETSK
tara:strand:- start:1427 stop:1714 length:288 start_codon:yes stop_codon:yes gene_type:complete